MTSVFALKSRLEEIQPLNFTRLIPNGSDFIQIIFVNEKA